MATRMLQRRGTAAEWAALDPVLADGEIGFERDTNVIKIGDGVTKWSLLRGNPGPIGPMGPQGPRGFTGATGPKGDTGLTGATGPQGLVGATGPVGPQGVPGPQGDKGPAGIQGPIGPAGPTGPAGTTTVAGLTDTAWINFAPKVYNGVDYASVVARAIAVARYKIIGKTCLAHVEVTLNAPTNNGCSIDLPFPATGRQIGIGTCALWGAGIPADQSGLAFMADDRHLVVAAFTNGYRDGVAGNVLRYNVFYEIP